ncbi:MAG: DUF504 domain-containing protein [Vicinamibacterales bacterium]
MQPLEELLSRIRWDVEFGRGSFSIAYLDRVAGGERTVPFEAIVTDPRRPRDLTLRDDDGRIVHIPLHRVRSVSKDGVIIWRRPER